ncbi:hypothetical protein [Streptomyces sp. CRN 30]|uniref:hypothetical protein n=1 Tax=Streptomyces sp. CRN 30 TaxID=3075613 RepID=UPI002A82629B|nr:hypothetical protein [Streptomyces sp. CRN 30]
MPYLYTCRQCRTRAPRPRTTCEDAETDQQEHRDAAHGGHAPLDGDGIRRVHDDARGDGLLPRHSCLAALVLLALVLANCWGR